MSTLTVKRKEGFLVRDPETGEELGDTPREVPFNTFWWRRISRGEVIEVTNGIKKAEEKKPPNKEVSK